MRTPMIVQVLGAALFASGFAAMLCQVVWQRLLGLIAGSDAIAAALVVGAVLTGLGLGSLLGAKFADRLTRMQALMAFAAAEIGVAVFALVSRPVLYDWLALHVAPQVDSQALVFVLCFAGVVVPTTLMGATLPLVARILTGGLETIAARIGTLYGMNTLGAGIGALVGGWLLVGNLGYEGALRVAAALDVLAALLVLLLVPALRRATGPEPQSGTPPQPARVPAVIGSLAFWCALTFASGFVIVALEILWVRVLGQFGQYHAYLFAHVLGIFLLADGAGMAAGARLLRHVRDPLKAFLVAQALGYLLAALLLLGLWWVTPHLPIRNYPSWVDSSRLEGVKLLASAAIAALVVAPPAFLIGMTFAFVQRAVQRDLAHVGSTVGWVQLANITGNAAGSLVAGLVALHWLGTAGTVVLLGLLTLGLLAALRNRPGDRPIGLTLGGAVALLVLVFPGNDAFWRRLHGVVPGQPVAWAEDRTGVAFWRDDSALPSHTAFRLAVSQSGNPFYIQGFSQGSLPPLEVHLLLGAIGPLLHPDPQRVLVIGVGSGGTPWAAGVHPATREILAVELVAPVLTTLEAVGRREPGGAIAQLFTDPRWRLAVADGRRLLSRAGPNFDVIEADAILPQGSHSGMLYSKEFLALVRKRLAPGGLYVQWAPTSRSTETFAAAFPHVVRLMPAGIMLGSEQPILLNRTALLARLREPAVARHLAAARADCCAWEALIDGPQQTWDATTPRRPAPLSDLFPRDEFYLNQGRNNVR